MFIYNMCKDYHTAEELTQETFFQAFRSFGSYKGKSDIFTWLAAIAKHTYYKHIGIYAYRVEVLKQITQMTQTQLELVESLEQLRWLENGLTIQTAVTNIETIGIDTPDDLVKAEEFLNSKY